MRLCTLSHKPRGESPVARWQVRSHSFTADFERRRGHACLERTRRRWLVLMKYTQLGRTGLKVSRLVLGTMNFGPQTDEATSHAIMDAALDAGLNFVDTANVYGWGENKGRTE